MNIRVELGSRSYDVVIVRDGGERLGAFASQCTPGRKALLVADENVSEHAELVQNSLRTAGFSTSQMVLPPGEAHKNLQSVSHLYDRLAEIRADRKTLVVAVGGGVIGDTAGFAAATWNRGLPLLMVPTTLLAMVDSSVGGKVGVNHPRGKNLIGAFHQPVGVWIELAFLETLPDREYHSALAEVVKYGVVLDAEFFHYLEDHVQPILDREPEVLTHIVAQCCRLKAQVVQADEREETGLRAILNYGHTFAHAFETVGGYGTWLHGEAVAAGLACAGRLAHLRGLIEAALSQRQIRLLQAFGLPTHPSLTWDVEAILEVMQRDKKNLDGRLRFVLPTQLGAATLVDDVPPEQVRQLLQAESQR